MTRKNSLGFGGRIRAIEEALMFMEAQRAMVEIRAALLDGSRGERIQTEIMLALTGIVPDLEGPRLERVARAAAAIREQFNQPLEDRPIPRPGEVPVNMNDQDLLNSSPMIDIRTLSRKQIMTGGEPDSGSLDDTSLVVAGSLQRIADSLETVAGTLQRLETMIEEG